MANLMSQLELDLASPVAAGPVHEGVHFSTGKAGEQNGLAVQRAMPCQERLPHAHDVCAMLRFGKLVQGLKHCSQSNQSGQAMGHDSG